MTEQEFKHRMGEAEALQKLTDDPLVADFWTGYIRGVRRNYYGQKFGTESEHKAWTAAAISHDESGRRRGMGYLLGWSGASIETAVKSQTGHYEDGVQEASAA